MRLATAQPLVTGDLAQNAAGLRRLIAAAAVAGANLVHFPEMALSGFIGGDVPDLEAFDWPAFDMELEAIRATCAEHGIGAVVGGPHLDPSFKRPFNSLYIISNRGELVARYDKRFCSHNEIAIGFAAGETPLVMDLGGIRLGFIICIEVNFPELFLEYERLDVTAVLFSSSHAKTDMFRIQAQGHAASNNFWISYSVPLHSRQMASACLIGPDGRIIGAVDGHAPGIAINDIVPTAKEWEVPLTKARPWRRLARKRDIYATSRELRKAR